MKKRLLCLLMSLAMILLPMLTACSSDEELGDAPASTTQNAMTLTMWVVCEEEVDPAVAAAVNAKINTLTRAKCKDKLWLVKITINKHFANEAKILLKENNIPFTFYDVEKYYVFDCYCNTQKETEVVTAICENFEGKMFATENKLNL